MDNTDPASAWPAVQDRPAEPATGRGTLDRQRILMAAITLIDEQGLGHLTMRRLGSHLGVEGMALYHYIPGRESLLDGVVETVVDELHQDADSMLVSSDWQDYLRRLARGVRRIALAHPEVFPLIATRPLTTPWTRPPLRSLHWTEAFLRALRDFGFSDDDAVTAYREFSGFLLGHLLLELASDDREPGADDPDPVAHPAPDSAEYPLLAAIEPSRLQPGSAEFEHALDWLLQRLALTTGS